MKLSHWIERWADFQPEKTAIRFEGRDISYRAFRSAYSPGGGAFCATTWMSSRATGLRFWG
jgi:hypothetical protein